MFDTSMEMSHSKINPLAFQIFHLVSIHIHIMVSCISFLLLSLSGSRIRMSFSSVNSTCAHKGGLLT